MEILPTNLHGALDYITSPGIVIPTLVLMILVIYNLISTSGLLKEANEDLKEQVCVNLFCFGSLFGIFLVMYCAKIYVVFYFILLIQLNIFLPSKLHYERTEARRKLLKEHGKTESSGVDTKISDRWKRVLGSALSSIPQDESKSQPQTLLSKVVALSRKYTNLIAYCPEYIDFKLKIMKHY